jgi:peptidoglycan/LPS O-acetylase OafA/YrhL
MGKGASILIKYRPDIEGPRAVSILQVVRFHTFPRDYPGGFIGVDVFFVISGYLISGHYLQRPSRRRIQFHRILCAARKAHPAGTRCRPSFHLGARVVGFACR